MPGPSVSSPPWRRLPLPAALRRTPVLLELELSRGVLAAPPASPLDAIRARHTPTLAAVVEALEKAAADDTVVGLVAHVGAWQPTVSQSEELRAAVGAVRAAGKRTVVWSETFGEMGPGNTGYHLACAFEQIWLQPSGDVGLVGLTAEAVFVRGALDKLGVQTQMGQRHEYKSAASTFLETQMTEPQREMMTRLVESSTDTIVRDVAHDRGLSVAAVREALAAGPLSAEQASEHGLVDHLGHRADVYAAVHEEPAGPAPRAELRYVERYARPDRLAALGVQVPGRGKPVVAVVNAVGPIHLGRSGQGGPLRGASIGSDTLAAALRTAARDDDVRAVVLRVDSPGGSYVASDAVRREIAALRATGRTVVASMGSVAASGGYFIAMPCERIVAAAGTLTGSIGVLAGKQVLRDALGRLGVTRETVAAGRYADMFSSDRPFDTEEWARLEEWLDRVYADFTGKAAEDRGMDVEDLRAVAKGRVWTGADAAERGLVDELGGLSRAVDVACGLASLDRGDIDVRTLPRPNLLQALVPPENSESPAAAMNLGPLGAGMLGEGIPLLDRVLVAAGLPTYGALTMPFGIRVR